MPLSRSPSRSSYTKASDDEEVDLSHPTLTSRSQSMQAVPSIAPIHKNHPNQPYPVQLSMHFSQDPYRGPLQPPEARSIPLPTDHMTNTFIFGSGPPQQHPDLFHRLRKFNIGTKFAWTAIPAHEGFKVVEICRSLSSTGTSIEGSKTPCYNRETIYDEEWQKHMKDVHGVFLLWPETWMKRIEVLDLDPFGGEIESCNDLIMG